jgi:inner membrane protein
MEPHPQSPSGETYQSDKIQSWLRTSATVRIFAIMVLVLLLLIPMGMIRNLISERENTRDAAINELNSKFAGEQLVRGPYLSVPYKSEYRDQAGKTYTLSNYLNFAPSKLHIVSQVDPLIKRRGIYEVVLYKSTNRFEGSFSIDNNNLKGVDPSRLEWDKAFLAVRVDDTRGIDNVSSLMFDGKPFEFRPSVPVSTGNAKGLHAEVNLTTPDTVDINFEMELSLDGSTRLMFMPVGKTTTAIMSSPWTNPSFDGTFISDSNRVSEEGFTASWRILEFNRNIPEFWHDKSDNTNSTMDVLDEGGDQFGVNLLMPVDYYQKSMRTAKYAILVIVLTFTLFFLVEVLNKKRIHPVQYVLVGLALTLFYSLLLALAEFISFDLAYLTGSIGIIGMITAYTYTIFRSRKLSLITGAILIAVYGFIYTILQLNDMAFILGNVGLFIALGIVMFLTRKLDWYSMKREG